MRPAGLDNSQGVISAAYAKDAQRSAVEQRSRHQGIRRVLGKYLPEGDRVDASAMTGYNMATTMVEVLRQCGDNLTRENVMKQAASLKQFRRAVCFPASRLSTGPDDFQPIEQLQMMQFKGERWQLFGDVISGELVRQLNLLRLDGKHLKPMTDRPTLSCARSSMPPLPPRIPTSCCRRICAPRRRAG